MQLHSPVAVIGRHASGSTVAFNDFFHHMQGKGTVRHGISCSSTLGVDAAIRKRCVNDICLCTIITGKGSDLAAAGGVTRICIHPPCRFGIGVRTVVAIIPVVQQFRLSVTVEVTKHIIGNQSIGIPFGSGRTHYGECASGGTHPVCIGCVEFAPAALKKATFFIVHSLGYHHIRLAVQIEIIHLAIKPTIVLFREVLIVNTQRAGKLLRESPVTVVHCKIPVGCHRRTQQEVG